MDFFDLIYVIILGIIEGITEWLPISSTGHLILAEGFLGSLGNETIFTDSFMEMFEVVIQLGAILAVVVIYFKKLWPFGFNKVERSAEGAKFKLVEENYVLDKKDKWLLWAKVAVACLPVAIIGVLFNDQIDAIFYNPLTISITLIVYGVSFILLELWNKKRNFKINDVKDISFKMALIIGCVQVLAVIPGTSRSGVTILIAMLLLCNRSASAEFSFFLSIPVMFGASALKLVKFMMNYSFMQEQVILLVIGSLVAFVVSIYAVKSLMSFIKKHGFTCFGIYRIALGIVIIICILTKLLPAF